MAPIIGFAFLLAVLTIGIITPIFLYKYRQSQSSNLTIIFSLSQLLFAVFAQICLIYSFIISDYTVLNIYQNSHHLKPLIYKISGSWGNHEGSMLLLITILCCYNFAFCFLSQISSYKAIICASNSIIIALFASFTAFVSNPFERNFNFATEGLGLNPILQDIGLALHPPMLYTGYIGVSIAFSFAIAGLLTEKIDKEFALKLKNWLYFSFAFLTAGIALGSWWAYRELGWGGYWFWDPVENVSLMPWISLVMLIHSLKSLEKNQIFKAWVILLSISSFILSLLGIFLVRSGVLTSVHSFAIDAKRGFFVIILLSIIGGIGLILFGIKMPKIFNKTNEKVNLLSKNGFILINNYFLSIALFVVILGTIYPIFSQGFFDQFIAIGPSYYNKIFSILSVPFLAFLAFSYYFSNIARPKKQFIIIALASVFITSLTFFFAQKAEILQLIILFLAVFVILISIVELLQIGLGKGSESFVKKANLTMLVSHFGFSLIICGIVLTSSFGSTKQTNLKIGDKLEISGYQIIFNNISYIKGSNYIGRVGKFEIFKNNKKITNLNPSLNYYPISNQTTNESSTFHSFFGDIYLVIGNKDEKENYAIRAYFKPFIWLIWLGVIMIFFAITNSIILTSSKAILKK